MSLCRWDTSRQASATFTLPAPARACTQTIVVTLHTERRTGFRFNLDFLSPDPENAYRVAVTVEWEGRNVLVLPVCALQPEGTPGGWEGVSAVRLSAAEPTRNDMLTVADVQFSDSVLPRPINPYEDALATFFVPATWQREDWHVSRAQGTGLFDLESHWFWTCLTMENAAEGDSVCAERLYKGGIAATDYESVIVLASIERGCALEVDLRLDGTWREALGRREGNDDFDETECPTCGAGRLDGLRLRLLCSRPCEANISCVVSWILLRRRASKLLEIRRNDVYSGPSPAPRTEPGHLEAVGLEAGLYVSAPDLPALRRKVAAGLGLAMWEKLRKRADAHLAHNPEPYVGEFLPVRRGESLTRSFVEATPSWEQMIQDLGTAYLVSDDRRYAEQARRVILAACRCAHWGTALQDRVPVGIWGYRAPFFPAHMAGAVAVGTDMISNVLSEEERTFIDSALMDKGVFWIEAYLERMEYCLHMNQGVVFAVGGLLAARVAERRRPAAATARRRLADYVRQVLDNYLDDDGASGEGAGYWTYTMEQAIRGLVPMARAEGRAVADMVPTKFARTVDYPLYLRRPTGDGQELINIGDCADGKRIGSDLLLFFARHMNRPDMMTVWHEQFGQPADAPDSVLSLLFYDPDLAPKPMRLALSKRFRGSDRVFWRSGWTPNDVMVMFESGPWGPDHLHYDKNQILLTAFGEEMLVDRGMCNYSNPLSASLKHTWCHNTVTIDGADQVVASRQPAAALEAYGEDGPLRFLSSEASAAYGGQLSLFRRELLLVDSSYVVLSDTVRGARGRIEWHFHTLLEPEPVAGGLFLRGRTGHLYVMIAAPEPWAWRTERILLSRDTSGPATEQVGPGSDRHLVITGSDKDADAGLLALFFPVAAEAENDVAFERLAAGWRIQFGEQDDRLVLEHGGGAPELQRRDGRRYAFRNDP